MYHSENITPQVLRFAAFSQVSPDFEVQIWSNSVVHVDPRTMYSMSLTHSVKLENGDVVRVSEDVFLMGHGL